MSNPYLIILFVIVLSCGVYVIISYNKLVKNSNIVKEAWSGIDVQLKQRYNLIPNLIKIVKGYMGHEKQLLEDITLLRTKAISTDNIKDQGLTESILGEQLNNLFIVAEDYPELKANENFLDLQHKLTDVEDLIQKSRRFYNGAVRNNNIAVESFPSNIVANLFRFKQEDFFEIGDPQERKVPKTDL